MDVVKRSLIILITFFVFSNILAYLTYLHKLPLPAFLIYLVFSVLVLYVSNKIRISKYTIFWASTYFILSTVYFFFSTDYIETTKYYKIAFITVLLLIVFNAVLLSGKNHIKLARKTILYTTIFNSILLIYDFMRPGLFIAFDSEIYNAGRATAMFLNSNIAGTVLLLGMIFSIDITKKQWREVYLLVILFGVLTTFSRSAILLYAIILVIYFVKKKINRKKVLIYIGIAISFLTTAIASVIGYLKNNDISTSNIEGRIAFILSLGQEGQNHSSDERLWIVQKAFEIYTQNPFFGNGFAATRVWEYPVSPHNFYATSLAEYGLLAILILPLLLYMVKINAQGMILQTAYIFIFFIAIKSIFTHNILESIFYIFCFSLMFAMSENSKSLKYNTRVPQ